MDDSVATSSPPLLSIRKYGDPVLRKKALPVAKFDDSLARLIPSMFRAMYEEPGIGLAAPQVGVSLRLMVVDVAPEGQRRPLVLINPKIEAVRGRIPSQEGCLSFPGIHVNVRRHQWVRVSALDEKGLPLRIETEGLLSRCLQHEMDHLDGVLMIDRVPLPGRWRVHWDIRRKKRAGLW
jgi:peptide deformylase